MLSSDFMKEQSINYLFIIVVDIVAVNQQHPQRQDPNVVIYYS